MKCLFVVFNFGSGGAEHVLVNFLKYNASCKNPWNISVFAQDDRGELKDDFYKYANVITLKKTPSFLKKIILNSSLLLNFFIFKKKSFDVSIAYLEGGPAKTVMMLKKTSKKIAWIHTDISFFSKKIKKRYYKIYNSYNDIAFVSKDIKEKFKKVYPELAMKNLTILHNPIDFEKIRKSSAEIPDNLRLKDGEFIVISVGRFSQEKGMDRVIEIAKKLKNYPIRFLLIGTGIEFEKIKNEVEMNKLKNVSLLGYKQNPFCYVRLSDLYLLPSRREGYPTCLCEALALNKPIFSSNCTGAKEVLSSAGQIFENDDSSFVEKVCLSLINIINNKSEYDDLVLKSIERSKDFDYEKKMENMRNYIWTGENE